MSLAKLTELKFSADRQFEPIYSGVTSYGNFRTHLAKLTNLFLSMNICLVRSRHRLRGPSSRLSNSVPPSKFSEHIFATFRLFSSQKIRFSWVTFN